MELDLHRLELRFAATRISDAPAVQCLANSIEENGQLVECVAAGEPADVRPVLIDGYRRVAALRRLGRDTAQVQCWSCPVGQALAQVLARSGSRAFTAIEEAMLLRELIDAHGLTQRDAARQCARDVSWVQRRLMLLGGLPEALLQAVRGARARAVDLVRSLPGCAVRAARTHGRAPAPVHRQLEPMRAQRECPRTPVIACRALIADACLSFLRGDRWWKKQGNRPMKPVSRG
jgi:ParB-like chromosome segregation protein Spo0J